MVGTELPLILQVEKEIDTEVQHLQGENNEELPPAQWIWRGQRW